VTVALAPSKLTFNADADRPCAAMYFRWPRAAGVVQRIDVFSDRRATGGWRAGRFCLRAAEQAFTGILQETDEAHGRSLHSNGIGRMTISSEVRLVRR
jgi:hypothetical protein